MAKKPKYDIANLGSFEQEWGIHEKCKEWWYCTGIIYSGKRMYSYQFTLVNMYLGIATPKIIMVALTDFQTGRHYYLQRTQFTSKGLAFEDRHLAFRDVAIVDRDDKGMNIVLKHGDFGLDLRLENGKGVIWHADKGRVQMGLPGDKETTYYYSWPNMPTKGNLTLGGKTLDVNGKTWFDKQGGSYSVTDRRTNWEWFSLRFDDDEEVMFQSFPQNGSGDGTYIMKDGKTRWLRDFTIVPTKFIECAGFKWSSGWDVTIPGVKEERYAITPIKEGNINFAYFEELCSVTNKKGEQVGMCFVELLPGVYNAKRVPMSNLLKKVEY